MVSVPLPLRVMLVVDATIALQPLVVPLRSEQAQLELVVDVNAGEIPVTVAVPPTSGACPYTNLGAVGMELAHVVVVPQPIPWERVRLAITPESISVPAAFVLLKLPLVNAPVVVESVAPTPCVPVTVAGMTALVPTFMELTTVALTAPL